MTPPEPRATLHNINLLVSDPDLSRRFYQQVFGLRLDERRSAPPAMLILHGAAGTTLSLKARDTEDAGKLAGPGDTELGFATDDLEGCHAALAAFGVPASPIIQLGFGRTFDAQDPDGHHLAVYSLAPENR